MRFIVHNKIYDTDKATLLCTFNKQWRYESFWGVVYPYKATNLYKTAKGAYYLTALVSDKHQIEVIDETEAKFYLQRHDYNKYVEMFGELEEA